MKIQITDNLTGKSTIVEVPDEPTQDNESTTV